jgi:putative ABC transport system permease protein
MRSRDRREENLDNEIRDYIERETLDKIAAGMTPDEARYAAARKLGPVLNVKEDTRAVWGWVWFERLAQDLRHGRRMLAKNPGFALVAIVSLAIGIGANCATFSFADAMILRPLAVLRPSDVVTVGSPESLEGFSSLVASYRDYVDFRDQSHSFDGLVAYTDATFGFATERDAPAQVRLGSLVTGNFFQAMGVEPELGRGFRPEEDNVPGRDAVVVLGHDLWAHDFAADRSVLGRKVRINGIEFTIVGVAPERFTGMNQFLQTQLYMPIMMWPRLVEDPKVNQLEARDRRMLTIKGRLRKSVSISQAQAELLTIARNLERAYPNTNRNRGVAVRTELEAKILQSPPDAELAAMLSVLAAAVLLVACANVAGLLTSRAPVRAREIALRLAIGAGRRRVIRQLLTESLLLAVAGGIAGLGLGYLGILFFRRLPVPTDLPINFHFELNQQVLLFSLAVALISAVLFGLAPAIQTTRADLVNALRSATSDAPGRRRLWGRNLLVAGQVALSLVLLAVSTFLYRGVRQELRQSPGFRTDHLLTMSFDPTLVHYSEAQAQQFFRQLADRARSTPGVKSAALTYSVPYSNQQDGVTVLPEGYQFPAGKESENVFANTVDEQYFATAGIPIARGRGFQVTDTGTSPHVAVVNEEFARHYWPGKDPIGKRFRLDDRNEPWVEIVGVAKTIKYLWIAEPPTDFLYLPLSQHPQRQMILLAESFGEASGLTAPLREGVHSLDASQPIFNIRTMEEFYRMRAVNVPNMIVQTVAGMGVMGLVLALVGLYGLVAYAAGRRTREIGIRMAIGAQRTSVLRMVMRQGLVLALAGIGAGLIATMGAERLLNAIFSAPGDVDVTTYLLVVPALLAVTLLAAYIPARRASRVDPMRALRYE